MSRTAGLTDVDDAGVLDPACVQFRNRECWIFQFEDTAGTLLEETRWCVELVAHNVNTRDIRNRRIVLGSELGDRMKTEETRSPEFLN